MYRKITNKINDEGNVYDIYRLAYISMFISLISLHTVSIEVKQIKYSPHRYRS